MSEYDKITDCQSKIWNGKFILLFIANILVLAAFYASIPIIPIYCQEVGITGAKIGIVLTAMSVATILFRPVAGYLLDNFNRYLVYVVFLFLFSLSFPAFIFFPVYGILIIIRLYMGGCLFRLRFRNNDFSRRCSSQK